MKRLIIITFLIQLGVTANSQSLSINMLIQNHKSSLGSQIDLGFPTNASITLINESSIIDLAYLEMKNRNLSTADTFFANYGVLTYSKMFAKDNFFNYFGFGLGIGNRSKFDNGNKVGSGLVFGPVLNAGIGLNLDRSFYRIGVLAGADIFGSGAKSQYSMLYFSIGFKIFERKKQ